MTANASGIHDFTNTYVLVIGDIMIDQYWFGEVKRISPEAPVPVVDLQKTENRLGGAANVARNLRAMGAQTDIIGIAGNDPYGKEVARLLKEESIGSDYIFFSDERRTTIKSRVMAQGQNLLRIDQEDAEDMTESEWLICKTLFDKTISERKPDIIILQDYNKGLLTEKSIPYFIAVANKYSIPTIVDPKKKNFFAYTGCTVFKPNKKEVTEALNVSGKENLELIHELLTKKLKNKVNFITLGADGIFVGTDTDKKIYNTKKRHIVDVCGAGDTVISILSLYWTKGLSPAKLAKLANIGGGQVCSVTGVSPVNRSAFLEEVENSHVLE
jgi:rfaE bifunctional protein kinase chain/domain